MAKRKAKTIAVRGKSEGWGVLGWVTIVAIFLVLYLVS